MESEKKDYRYEFVVQDLTKEQARAMMEAITQLAELAGARVGGGYWEETHEEGEEQDQNG